MKDKHMLDTLANHFRVAFELPDDAVDWLLMMFHVTQFFDDVADGDPVERDDLNMALWNTLYACHHNRFFIANGAYLLPLVGSMIMKWQASDAAERDGNADARSFVWRAGYYDLVLAAIQLCHGVECAIQNAHHVMSLYGEKLEDYLEEFHHA